MKRQELLKAINSIKPGLSENSIVQQADLVLFDTDRVMSYNDEIAVSMPFDSGIMGGIPANELLKLLQKMEKDEIKTTTKENQIIFQCGRTKAGFNVKEVEAPELGIDDKIKWKNLPKDFIEAMMFCIFSAATDISKGILTCLKAEEKEMVTCDNFRLTQYKMASKVAPPLLIPYQSARALINHQPVKFAISDNWLHFQGEDGSVLSCRTMEGDYPDIDHLFEVEGITVPLPPELKKTLGRTEVLAEDNETGKSISLTLDKGKITCHGESVEGWVTETIKTDYDDKKVSFKINPGMLSQILDKVNEAQIGDTKIRFDGDNFVHVIALTAAE